MSHYFAKASVEQYPRVRREMLQDNSARRKLMKKQLRVEDITADKAEGVRFTIDGEKSRIYVDACGNICFRYEEYGGTGDYLRAKFQEFFRIKLVRRMPFVRPLEAIRRLEEEERKKI